MSALQAVQRCVIKSGHGQCLGCSTPCHSVGMTVFLRVFQLICSYLFYPLSFLMGVDADDRLKMGELIGTKTFLNEFYAYTELSVYINNRKTLNEYVDASIVL